MVKVKFCGIRREEDVTAINHLKPDFAGFVFAKSLRQVSPEQAAVLRQKLNPAIQTVAVLVNRPAEEAAALANEGIVDFLQLHGDEDDAYIRKLKTMTGAKIIKAVRLRSGGCMETTDRSKAGVTVRAQTSNENTLKSKICISRVNSNRRKPTDCMPELNAKLLAEATQADYYLFDTFLPDAYGGTGKTFSLSLLNNLPIDKPFFLAGGLDAGNVVGIIGQVQKDSALLPYFYGVDVSGGIETNGYKDPIKMEAFMKAIRG